jgi:hypothetical protein
MDHPADRCEANDGESDQPREIGPDLVGHGEDGRSGGFLDDPG